MVAHSNPRTSLPRPADPISATVPPAGTKASPSPSSDTAADPLLSQPRKQPKPPPELAPVAAAMLTVGITESVAIKQLFGFCRDNAPDCTPEEVAIFVQRKIVLKQGKRVANWIGYLLFAVPPCFQAPGFEAWRKESRAFDATENANTERQQARARRILDLPAVMRRPNGDWRDADGDLVCDDGDREWARRILGETERAVGVA